jgi:polar amino acid transport system substrate-binding protein
MLHATITVANYKSGIGMKYFFIALIINCFSIAQLHANEPFVWVDDENYEPYIYAAENQQVKGLYRDLMVEAFDRMEIPLEYDVCPWKRAQLLVKNGTADAMISVATTKRLVYLSATDPVTHMDFHVFAKSDNPRIMEIMAIESIEDLKGFDIISYLGNGWAERNFKGLTVDTAPNFTSAILMLAKNRGDVFVDGSIVVKYAIKELLKDPANPVLELKSVVESQHTLETIPYSLLIRKDSRYHSIIPKFNKTLREIRHDGTYDRILDQYIKY